MKHNTSKKIKDINVSKKAAVLGEQKKNRKPLFAALLSIAAMAVGILLYLAIADNDTVESASGHATTQKTTVTFPVNIFDDGKARHFEYVDGTVAIRYFILKSADGVVRAAFDACDVCWPAGKGYYQEGDVMVCRNCGRRFTSVKINEVKGGCNPAPLAREVKNEQLVIQIKDIKNGRSYFNFNGKI